MKHMTILPSGARAAVLALALGSILSLPLAREAAAQSRPAAPARAAPAATTDAAHPEYRLAAGDVIRISVFQNPDLSVETRIGESGVVSYPLLGSVTLGGLTVPQAEKRIADGLRERNFVKQPQVAILVSQVRGHQVSVLGQVSRPGRYPLETGDVSLTDLLATVGGITPNGSDTVIVQGTRDGRPFRTEVDFPSIFEAGQRGGDLQLRNGDVIWVERAPVIYIYGEVQRPGTLRLERDMSVLQVLAASGGVTQRGTEKGIRVHRRGADGRVQILQPAMDDTLRPDDVVYVRESLF